MSNIYEPKWNIDIWNPTKGDLCSMLYDISEYLHNNPVWSTEEMNDFVEQYFQEHPITGAVQSVAGKTGAVTLNTGDISYGQITLTQALNNLTTTTANHTTQLNSKYSAQNPPPYPVTSVNGQTGAVVIETGGAAPVQSVAGKTGAVTLNTADINYGDDTLATGLYSIKSRLTDVETALPNKYSQQNPPPYPVTSVNGMTGAVVLQTGGTDMNITKSNIASNANISVQKGIYAYYFNFTHQFTANSGNTVVYKLFDAPFNAIAAATFLPEDITGSATIYHDSGALYMKVYKGAAYSTYIGGTLCIIAAQPFSSTFLIQVIDNTGD